jgi:hypothetical protein
MQTIKPLDRLLFAQRGLCFFCQKPLPKTEASIEHLVAKANDGSDRPDNCVACCKSLNQMFGSMSLKEKFQVFLNRKEHFQCPNGVKKTVTQTQASPKVTKPAPERYERVVADLKKRGEAKPQKLTALRNTIASLFPQKISRKEVTAIIQQLQRNQVITVAESKVTYVSL